MYYIYILRCQDNSLYIGITTDIKRRFHEHISKANKGAKNTKAHAVESIEFCMVCQNRSIASKMEYRLKTLSKKQKENLIQNHDNLKIYFQDQLDLSLYEIIQVNIE